MSASLNLRKSLACVLMFSSVVTGLISITTRPSHASNDAPPHPFTSPASESSEKTAPQASAVDEATRARAHEAYGKMPLSFEENRGQVDEEVKYISRGSGYTLYLTPTEAVLSLRRSDGKNAATTAGARRSRVPASPDPARADVLRMKLKGANRAPALTGESEMGVRTNYFKGNDPRQWHTGVARFERVRYAQVYTGIDMIYYGQQQQLEYDFEVAPEVDARQIALEYAGVKRVKIERSTGELVLETAGGEVRQHRPVAYQEVGGERREVLSRYVMKGKREVGIEVGEYDRTKTLVIDPVLTYSTFLDGSYDDAANAIAVDSAGNAYVTGWTDSPDFPTRNQYQTNQPNIDAFVMKLNTNLSGSASLLYSTYLGASTGSNMSSILIGGGADFGTGIAVDSSGIVYVTGYTDSSGFPTLNQYQTYQGEMDAFVTKLDTNLSGSASLLYSTYLGGSSYDRSTGIAVDSTGNAYVTGTTNSANFPTLNGYQKNQPYADAFVTKLDTKASGAASLVYSTYLGGGNDDGSNGIAVDSSGIVYVTGSTASTNFPTRNQYQTNQPSSDAFVTKLDTNVLGAASLLYSTYLGGSGQDYGSAIAVDQSCNAYVTGETYSVNFPTLYEYQQRQGDDNTRPDAFVTRLYTCASGAASLGYSTYLGGSKNDLSTIIGGNDYGTGIAADQLGVVYVTGDTTSSDFPTLNQYKQRQRSEYADAFVAKLDTYGYYSGSLIYSTYLGGGSFEYAYGIAVDSAGNAYVTGMTFSTNFPLVRPFQSRLYDRAGFVTKLQDTALISGQVMNHDYTAGVGGVTVTLSGTQSRTTVTNSNGDYSFLNLQKGGTYTVTPSKGSLVFIPPRESFSDVQTNLTGVFFTTRPATISGRVAVGSTTGAGLPGVTMTLAGGAGFTPLTVNTTSTGAYSFSNLPTPGNYKLTPSKVNYSFSPVQLALINLAVNQPGTNFIATLKTYTVGGVIKFGTAGLAGVTVKLTSPTPLGFTTRTATTDSVGVYSFLNVPAGRDYTVTPMRIGYQFTPTATPLVNLISNKTTVNFSVKVYTIVGRVLRAGTSMGIGAVTMTITSPTPAGFAARTVQTNSTGYYSFTSLPAGRNYTIKPTKSGFTFSPVTRSFTNLSGNVLTGTSTIFTGTGP